MARYDVHLGKRGFMLDVQADPLDNLDTRISVPLIPKSRLKHIIVLLNPEVLISGKSLILGTHPLLTMPKSELGPVVASLAPEADAITRALDMALTGF